MVVKRTAGIHAKLPTMRRTPGAGVAKGFGHYLASRSRSRAKYQPKASPSHGCSREQVYSPSIAIGIFAPRSYYPFCGGSASDASTFAQNRPVGKTGPLENPGRRQDVRSVRARKAPEPLPLAAESQLATEFSKRRRSDDRARCDWLYSVRAAPRRMTHRRTVARLGAAISFAVALSCRSTEMWVTSPRPTC